MNGNLEQLRAAYNENKVVPFIGAGLSEPFKIPTWGNLIRDITHKYATGNLETLLPAAVEWHLENNDYWGAIDQIKNYAGLIDQDIQRMIVQLIRDHRTKLEDESEHNYSDLAKMNFKLHLTTNYDNLLHENIKCDELPILLKDIDFSTQDMFDDKRVCHLHGYTANSGSIVVSRSSYESLYNNEKYGELLKAVTSSKHLLFMGFSFDDKFVSGIIKDYKKYLNGMHFIFLDNPSSGRIKELREDYGLIAIPYKKNESSHVKEIRKILQYINSPVTVTEEIVIPKKLEGASPIVVGAGLKDFKKNVEGNLFFKKLKLENIDKSIIELSSAFYVAAEEYIRNLQKAGMTVNVIDAMLGKVFIKYKERYVDTYKKYGDSERFLMVVHESLEDFDFGRHALILKENKSDENENRGLIHVLAENEDEEIWWGEERLNGNQKK
jgi:SIR2-like domain